MSKPLAYDVFCGAGGATKGYQDAGFYVVGVDIKPQKNYCGDEFIQMDAFVFLSRLLAGEYPEPIFIHTSPPCQAYSLSRNNGCHKDAPDLVGHTRAALVATGKIFVIENVAGAPLHNPVQVCGASFGLGASGFDLNRHRYFESNIAMLSMPCQHKRGKTIGVYGNGTNSWHREKFGRCISVAEMREAMGIPWMTRAELSQAIPPKYTEFIGRQLLRILAPGDRLA